MSAVRNPRGHKFVEPVYQNVYFRKPPPPPPPAENESCLRECMHSERSQMEQMRPSWNTDDSSRADHCVDSGNLSCAEGGCACERLYKRSVDEECSSRSDDDWENTVYDNKQFDHQNPTNCTTSIPGGVPFRDKMCPPIPAPRRRITLSNDQKNCFQLVPPPPPSSSGRNSVVKAFTFSGYQAVKCFSQYSSSDESRNSVSLSPTLIDCVPPFHQQGTEAHLGYVPHKPITGAGFAIQENGYLRMNNNDRPPFDNLWIKESDTEMYEDDPEYFTFSEFYANEPLYQIYHKEAVVRDVLEQVMEDIDDVEYSDYQTVLTTMLQRKSEKRPVEAERLDVDLTVENLLPAAPGARKLWADTPRVKASGILDTLSSETKRHQECCFEIITSEASYLKSLKLLEMHFMESPYLKPQTSKILTKTDYHYLFSSVRNVIAVSNKMLQKLEYIWKKNIMLDAGIICQNMKMVAEESYSAYVSYLANVSFQEKKLTELNTKGEFRYVITQLEDASEVNGLKLQSFLVLPLQRIARIPLLIDAVVRGLNEDDPATADVNACLTVFQKMLSECNEKVRQIENLQCLNELSQQIVFRKTGRTIPIVSQSRSLIKKGALVRITPVQKSKSRLRVLGKLQEKVFKERSTRHLFLFNDLLLITKKKNNQFEVVESSEKKNIYAEAIDENNSLKYLPHGIPNGCDYLFCLVILHDQSLELILLCESENERMRWIEACNPSTRNDEDETIYEVNDCPQVQTVKRFVANEPDELGLEESDIVNVLCKTQDGWYEGERIRDGRRGWFLANHTIEIENAHKRAKNRLQQWRLLRQTSVLHNH